MASQSSSLATPPYGLVLTSTLAVCLIGVIYTAGSWSKIDSSQSESKAPYQLKSLADLDPSLHLSSLAGSSEPENAEISSIKTQFVSLYPANLYEGGAYVEFPKGRVRFWLFGPEDGVKVVLIHGLTFPSVVWRFIAPQLAKEGMRVLIYDLYGRGYSDAPHTTYNAELYTTQLALLMQHVKWEQAYIVGFSMGGGIAACFAATFPHLVMGRIALIASAGMAEKSTKAVEKKRWVSLLRDTLPVLSMIFGPSKSANSVRPSETSSDLLRDIVGLQSKYLLGYNHAVASSVQDGPLRGLDAEFAKVGAMEGVDVLLIWGTDDPIVPFRYAARIQEFVRPPKSSIIAIEGGKHDVPVTHPKMISSALHDFFIKANNDRTTNKA